MGMTWDVMGKRQGSDIERVRLPRVTCHLPPPPAGCRLPPAACHLPPAACHLPPAACCLPPAAWRLRPAACRLPPAPAAFHGAMAIARARALSKAGSEGANLAVCNPVLLGPAVPLPSIQRCPATPATTKEAPPVEAKRVPQALAVMERSTGRFNVNRTLRWRRTKITRRMTC